MHSIPHVDEALDVKFDSSSAEEAKISAFLRSIVANRLDDLRFTARCPENKQHAACVFFCSANAPVDDSAGAGEFLTEVIDVTRTTDEIWLWRRDGGALQMCHLKVVVSLKDLERAIEAGLVFITGITPPTVT